MIPRLVCLIGAECTGKTTLAHALATRLDGLWVPEYLREFTARQGRTPLHGEQSRILQQQLTLQDTALEQARQQQRAWVFCDTAPLLTAVYSDCVFGDASLYPLALALHKRYAHTLFLETDLPWVADGLQRDGLAVQAQVQARIQECLHDAGLPWRPVAGHADLRLQAALHHLGVPLPAAPP